ncbi:MAG TPA: hypothetical protein GXX46_05900 [Peptococcaceae bacterium]|nr:hypothetical protein [Peptococcaceae bacterium]
MKIVKIIITFVVISVIFLNSTLTAAFAFAPVNFKQTAIKQTEDSGRQKLLSPKDQAALEKFQEVKDWLEEQSSRLKKLFEEAIANFKTQIARLTEELRQKFEEFKEQLIDRYYTMLEAPAPVQGNYC